MRVGDPDVIQILRFEAQGCGAFCLFGRGEEITFILETSAVPDRYFYDWDGNGIVDEVSSVPVSHAYEEFGIYLPKVRVERGEGEDRAEHGELVLID